MNCKGAVVFSVTFVASGFFPVAAQQAAAPMVFTASQAEAGQRAFEASCGRCHTYSLRGRKGEEGEVPPLASLPPPFLKFIGTPVHVPPLIGKDFVRKYGQKTVAEMFTLFRGAADTTPVSELHMSDDTMVNVTAYILQRNGAKPGNQPMTSTVSAAFGSVVE